MRRRRFLQALLATPLALLIPKAWGPAPPPLRSTIGTSKTHGVGSIVPFPVSEPGVTVHDRLRRLGLVDEDGRPTDASPAYGMFPN